MSYISGDIINKLEYNTFANRINTVYSDTASSPDWNYGRVGLAVANKVTGDVVTAADWNSLFETMHRVGIHQGTSLSTVPRSVSAGTPVVAIGTVDSTISNLEGNRFNIAVGQFTYTPNRNTKTRSTSWSTAITQVIDVQFTSYDAARYFFNLGGSVTFNTTRSGAILTLQDQSWNDTLNSIGEVRFNHQRAASMNGYKNTYNIGFFNLVLSPQVVYNATPSLGGGSYATDYLEITGQLVTTVSTNDTVRFVLKLASDGVSVSSGTFSSQIGDVKSSGEIIYSDTVIYTTSSITGS